MIITPGFIVLAAGASKRYGSNKLLAPFSQKQVLLTKTVGSILAVSDQLLVICNPRDEESLTLLETHQIPYASTQESAQGMAHTLAFGVRQRPNWGGWIICLADMPAIKPLTYSSIQNSLMHHPIVIPQFRSKPGNPVGFQASFFNSLIQLKGDLGAKLITETHWDQVYHLECYDPGILLDVDTPEMLETVKPLL